jgi:hypothetical protein
MLVSFAYFSLELFSIASCLEEKQTRIGSRIQGLFLSYFIAIFSFSWLGLSQIREIAGGHFEDWPIWT